MKHQPINLYNANLLSTTEADDLHCDIHRRNENERRAQQQIDARNRLILRFTPFILLTDQNREPVDLMETVAKRLMDAARLERERRAARIAAE
jgi:hypothetical protein